MPDTGKLKVTAQGDREIVMTRSFEAPRSLVFEALTNGTGTAVVAWPARMDHASLRN